MAHTQLLVVAQTKLAEAVISEDSIVEGVVEVARLFPLQCVKEAPELVSSY